MTDHPLGPPISLPLGKSVLYVELFDLERKERIHTFHRERSRCTFTEELIHHHFRITLRLDWGELIDGEPVLDMDVLRVEEGDRRVRVRPKDNPVHHTSISAMLTGNTVPRVYDVAYEGLKLRLVAKKTFAVGVGLSVNVINLNEPSTR